MTPLDATAGDLETLALEKMTKILGDDKGRRLMRSVLHELGLARIDTPDDLYRFSTALSGHGMIEQAVGAVLGFNALMRGARAHEKG